MKDVINLRTRSRNTYRRQNKSLDVTGEGKDNVKKDDENVEEKKTTNNPELSTKITSKRIEQTKQENGDKVHKETRRKNPKRAENHGIPASMRRNNDGSHTRRNNKRRRTKNSKQNIKEDIENTTKKPNSNINDAKIDSQENTSENASNAKKEQNVEEVTQTTMNDSATTTKIKTLLRKMTL